MDESENGCEDIVEDQRKVGETSEKMEEISANIVSNYLRQIGNYSATSGAKVLFTKIANEFLKMLIDDILAKKNHERLFMITPDDIYHALERIGFGLFNESLKETHKDANDTYKNRKRLSNTLKDSGLSEEELIRRQQELIADARKQHQRALQEKSNECHPDGTMEYKGN